MTYSREEGTLNICVSDLWKIGYIYPIINMHLVDETLLVLLKVLSLYLFYTHCG